jgi:DNA-binding CsgD family transcriptional regulator
MNVLPEAADYSTEAPRIDPHHVKALFEDVGTVQKLRELLTAFSAQFRLDNFFFLAVCPPALGQFETTIVSNLPTEWCSLYKQQQLVELDPTARHCRLRITPSLWWRESEPAGSVQAKENAIFIQQARREGLCSGVSFPIHGARGVWGMLNLSSRDGLPQSRERLEWCMPYGQIVGGYLLEAAIRISAPHDTHLYRQLTKREEECLTWCSEGKTSWEIAKILGISERTVFFHVQNASRKLNASTRTQAVRRACLT